MGNVTSGTGSRGPANDAGAGARPAGSVGPEGAALDDTGLPADRIFRLFDRLREVDMGEAQPAQAFDATWTD